MRSEGIFMRSEGSCCCFSYLKVLLGAVAVGLIVWLLIVGSPPPAKTTSWPAAGSEAEGRHVMNQAEEQLANSNKHPELDHNFMSKVKVPKGPDPIHNRRIGVKGKPPTGA